MTRWFNVAAVLTALAFGTSAYFHLLAYDQVPARIPYHFGLTGDYGTAVCNAANFTDGQYRIPVLAS